MNRQIVSVAALALASSALAGPPTSSPVLYEFVPLSSFTRERCLPPCACALNQSTGPITGLFRLKFDTVGSVFDRYLVLDVQAQAMLQNIGPISLSGAGEYRLSTPAGLHVMQLDLRVGSNAGTLQQTFDSDVVALDPLFPFPSIAISMQAPQAGCTRDSMTLIARPVACEANCDGSTVAPLLNANDFACFLRRFVSRDLYANCDGSTDVPALNALDFSCFLMKYQAGCPAD